LPESWREIPFVPSEASTKIISPAEKKIRSVLEKIASYNVLLDGTTRREMENVRCHCKHHGVDSSSELPPPRSPSASRPRKIRK
ncbi:hypothetical protein CDAR_75181, partial [Caerostris darwini]